MGRVLKAEWSRLCHSIVPLVFLGAFLVFGFFIFILTSCGKIDSLPVSDVKKVEQVFWHANRETIFPIIVSLFFPTMFTGLLFENRGMSQDVMTGCSRVSVFLTRILEIYLLSCLMCAVYPLIQFAYFWFSWFFTLDGAGWAFVLRCIGVKMVLDMGTMGIGLVLGFALRDYIRPPLVMLGFLLVFIVVSSVFGSTGVSPTGDWFSRFIPLNYYNLIVERDATGTELLHAVLYTLPSILIPSGLSYLLFRKAELK